MNSGALQSPKRGVWPFLVIALAVTTAIALAYIQKIGLTDRFTHYLSDRFRDAYGLTLGMDDIKSNVFGFVAIEGLIARTAENSPESTFLTAREITFQYELWDFLRGDFTGGVNVIIDEPYIFVDQPILFKKTPAVEPQPRFFQIAARIIERLAPLSEITVKNARLVRRHPHRLLGTFDGKFYAKSFETEWTLEHLRLADIDLSTNVLMQGAMTQDDPDGAAEFAMDIRTRQTVMNLRPAAKESHLSLKWSKDNLRILDADFMGGIRLDGEIGLEGEGDMLVSLKAESYPLANLDTLMDRSRNHRVSGRMDADLTISGPLLRPHVQGDILIRESRMGQTSFKNIQMTLAGVLPDVRVSESRVVLLDGTIMNFAQATLPLGELFKKSTYDELVRSEDQEMVVWGDWRMSRPPGETVASLQRDLADGLSLKYQTDESDSLLSRALEPKDQFALEYAISDSNSLSFELGEEEEFIGIHKKAAF